MIAIIDYEAGNTCSVMNALNRLSAPYILTDNRHKIKNAEKVIFPGVGHATMAMNMLKKKGLIEIIRELAQPVLGICLGMQLLCEHSMEGSQECLGLLSLQTKIFQPTENDKFTKVPHMGWNAVDRLSSPLFKGIPEESYMYFVHSYYVPDSVYTIACTNYNHNFAAAVRKDNFYGVQFHPEKSGQAGEQLLRNFASL